MAYYLRICIVLVLLAWQSTGTAQHGLADRNYLIKALKGSGFRIEPARLADWRREKKDRYLREIAQLPVPVRESLVKKAESALVYSWPNLPASLYLEYKNTGNRINFERLQVERREKLSELVIGELVTGNKKYMPQIVNGLWATLEESTWEIPAIIGLQKAGTDLPDPDETIIGLVSAETGLMVATIDYMLRDQLEAVSPMISRRVRWELQRRIIAPYLGRNDLWWMGFKGQPVNNWNAWINVNVLETGLLACTDSADLNKLLEKVFTSTDFFIDQYPADGGCEEGPAYWSLAGGKLVHLLALAGEISAGALDWHSNEFLHSMGTYIVDMHIRGDWFVDFADAGPHVIPDPVSVYRFGELFSDDRLKGFARYLFSLKGDMPPDSSVTAFLETAGVYPQLTGPLRDTGAPAFAFLPALQVFTARSLAAGGAGLFVAMQGGNNGESHNHNDVGNFILYAGGLPVLVDAGSGLYTAQTFSPRRYELWNMQSQWHNCPLINGVMQVDGKKFRASRVEATSSGNRVRVAMGLENAYPDSAFVNRWDRTFMFDRKAGMLALTDAYTLVKRTGETRIDLLAYCVPRDDKPGAIGFYNSAGRRVLTVKYPAGLVTPSVEEKKMDDEKLLTAWGAKLYRLSFHLRKEAPLHGKITLLFTNK